MPIVYINKKHYIKIAAFVVCALMFIGICFLITNGRKNFAAGYATNDEIGKFSTAVSDIPSRVKFFKQFNIDIKPSSEIKSKITIPEKFNKAYKYYNTLQKQAGFNLEKYKGLSAERAVYSIKKNGTVTILIYKGNVIAGHIESGVYGETYKPLTGLLGNETNP